MFKKIHKSLLVILTLLFILPYSSLAQSDTVQEETYYRAEILEIISEKEIIEDNATNVIQQDLRVRILTGDRTNQEILVQGISDITLLNQRPYKTGENVILLATSIGDRETYVITDAVRTGPLIFLAILFIAVVIVVGRKRGIRALIVLTATMLLIVFFIVPQIISGASPVMISCIAGAIILALAIYGTEGISPAAHISFTSILGSLVILTLLSVLFTNAARLTGLASEDVIFLIGFQDLAINVQGLLLAGIIIGSLGVLDDTVVSQVSVVRELASTDPKLTQKSLFKKALRVGIDHITAIINTLFLAYAGVSLPLLIIFSLNQPPFIDAFTIFNNEIIATEIVRTLVGSIALVLSVPLATFIAAYYFSRHTPAPSGGHVHMH
ncbi:MAG: YibE/F family protein [Patescibacteria group bacterium]